MTRDEIAARIRTILVESFQISESSITGSASFRGDLMLDSLDIVEFITLLQKRFGYRASMEQYREIDNIHKLVCFIEGCLKSQG